jgi:prenylcysteine oxidase / farnesylcysteine lyase
LTLTSPGEGSQSAGDYTAIYDGEKILYRSVEGEGWWWDVARLWWRYGLSPYSAVKLVKSTVSTFLKLYEAPFFPFRSLTERVFELGLHKVTAVTGEEYLSENGIKAIFAREIIQAATRVNYASNLAYIHGLEAMVGLHCCE